MEGHVGALVDDGLRLEAAAANAVGVKCEKKEKEKFFGDDGLRWEAAATFAGGEKCGMGSPLVTRASVGSAAATSVGGANSEEQRLSLCRRARLAAGASPGRGFGGLASFAIGGL